MPTQRTTWPLLGQSQLGRLLSRLDSPTELPAVMLMTGPAHTGKSTGAQWIAQRFLCTASQAQPCGQCSACRQVMTQSHPAVVWLDGQTESISIDHVRAALHRWQLAVTPSEWRWLLVTEADQLTEAAGNALLKFLEELPSQTTVLMTSSRLHRVLPTLQSRATIWRWHLVNPTVLDEWLSTEQPAMARSTRHAVIARAAGRPGVLMAQIRGQITDETVLKDFFSAYGPQLGQGQGTEATEVIESWVLAARELLLTVIGSTSRPLWPLVRDQFQQVATSWSIERAVQLAEESSRVPHLLKQNVQSRLISHDLLLA